MIKINFFKKEKIFKKKDLTFHLNFYWRIILFCAVVIIISAFIFSYLLFTQTNQEIVLPVVNNDGQFSTINKDRINQVLNYFSEREKKSTEILNSPAPIVDPSL